MAPHEPANMSRRENDVLRRAAMSTSLMHRELEVFLRRTSLLATAVSVHQRAREPRETVSVRAMAEKKSKDSVREQPIFGGVDQAPYRVAMEVLFRNCTFKGAQLVV